MKIIIYKMRAKRYECAEIRDSGGDELQFIFEVPLNATLTLGKEAVKIKDGAGKTSVSRLPEGDIVPKLFSGGKIYYPEGFTVTQGTVLRKCPDEEYMRSLASFCEELSGRISVVEKEIIEIQDKITQKISF